MYFHVVTEISVYTLSGMVHTVNIYACHTMHYYVVTFKRF